ncbi:I78 family peptidase inhibitor [Acidovorax sp. sic0104]|uniref:I78 family peptidase inhibitor n=1 Tax=Acidovorax sp. sic0104 TaxID=2854784 RepID=UPI001C4408F1|nr:I78 family peptidase inhibitor [Acidovorax sp. sic0104]MBV7539830.1 proteinase inhibitor I78 [Acidovorax sp. sic0104]
MNRTTRLASTSLILAAAAAMGACSGYGTTPAPSSSSAGAGAGAAPPPPGGQCNAQPAQGVVGQSSTSTVVESARARSGAQMARILRPGQMITKEFNAQRLNLEVDANGRILAVTCG